MLHQTSRCHWTWAKLGLWSHRLFREIKIPKHQHRGWSKKKAFPWVYLFHELQGITSNKHPNTQHISYIMIIFKMPGVNHAATWSKVSCIVDFLSRKSWSFFKSQVEVEVQIWIWKFVYADIGDILKIWIQKVPLGYLTWVKRYTSWKKANFRFGHLPRGQRDTETRLWWLDCWEIYSNECIQQW